MNLPYCFSNPSGRCQLTAPCKDRCAWVSEAQSGSSSPTSESMESNNAAGQELPAVHSASDASMVTRNPAPHAAVPHVTSPSKTLSIPAAPSSTPSEAQSGGTPRPRAGATIEELAGFWRRAFEGAYERNAELQRDLSAALKQYEQCRHLVNELFDGLECRPTCDSYAHAEDCPIMDGINTNNELRAQLSAAQSREQGLREALQGLCDAKRPLDWSPTIQIVEAFAKARAALASNAKKDEEGKP